MSFILFPNPTPVFPTLPPLAWSVHKKPSIKTLVSIAISGREAQFARQVFPIWEFTLTYGGDSWLRDQTQNIVPYGPLAGFTEWEQLSGLFLQCLGSYGEFNYKDPDDSSRVGVNQGTTLGGSVTEYPLYFTWGSGPFTPSFYAPVTGLESMDAVYLNGVLQDPSTYSTLLAPSGMALSFNSAPAAGATITTDFHFYYRCRFSDDMQEYEMWAENLTQNKTLKFKSVKP